MFELDDVRYAAYAYLDEWLVTDRPCQAGLRAAVQSGDVALGGKILAKFASVYGVSRTLKLISGEDRLASAFSSMPKALTGDASDAVCVYATSIAEAYKGKAESAATKFLWLMFPRAVIIYDAYAWEWIRKQNPHSDHNSNKMEVYYRKYCECWERDFECNRESIENVCKELFAFRAFTLASRESPEEVSELLSSEWFHRRVFDRLIQRAGEAIRVQKVRPDTVKPLS